ncbi:MAG: hypothetical protein JW928_03350 [Candidatus Aureabacteria bacterium]|nr:hypothetical protein [Candidatus Auribacterota bacterium]
MEPHLTAKNLDAVLKYLPVFEKKDIRPGDWQKVSQEGLLAYNYNDIISEFIYELYSEGFIIAFNWPKWKKEGEKLIQDRRRIEKANLVTLQKLLTMHVRMERFREGYLASIIKSGHMRDILKRIEAIRRKMNQKHKKS